MPLHSPWETSHVRSPTIAEALCVALGGAAGTLARYGVGLASHRYLGEGLPYGTLAVNLAGCFLMGLAGFFTLKTHAVPQFVVVAMTVGFLGGFTTFSAFGNETFRHFEAGRPAIALGNILANVVGGLLAVWLGAWLARTVVGSE
jgi:CrcB protein